MPKSGWIVALLPLLAFSMTLGAQSSKDWSGLRRLFRQQVSDAGIVGASLVIVREGKIEADEYVGYQEEATRRPVDRHHAAARSRTAGPR
jgi:CubicO group peptidase (beta-lactamase class C family)